MRKWAWHFLGFRVFAESIIYGISYLWLKPTCTCTCTTAHLELWNIIWNNPTTLTACRNSTKWIGRVEQRRADSMNIGIFACQHVQSVVNNNNLSWNYTMAVREIQSILSEKQTLYFLDACGQSLNLPNKCKTQWKNFHNTINNFAHKQPKMAVSAAVLVCHVTDQYLLT